MAFISFSNNLEDVMLWRVFGDIERGCYVDVHAGSGARGSVTRAFYEKGWVGLNISSDTTAFQTLATERPRDIHLNTSLGPSDDDQGETLASTWQACIPGTQPVHFLHLDAEGTERQAIRGNDWTRFRPWVLVIASRATKHEPDAHEDWEPLLLGHQYRFVYADGLSRFYVAEEHVELLPCFRYPPNVFDDFITEPHDRAESALSEARLRLRAIETKYQEVLSQALGAKFEVDRLKAEEIERKAEMLAVLAKHDVEIRALLDSLSWRITYPVRMLQSGIRSLFGPDWKSRLKSTIKKPIVCLARKTLRHRTSKALAIRLVTRLGLYDRFKSLLSGQSFFGAQTPNEPYAPSRYWIATSRSRRVRSDLNAEIEQIKRERA